MMQLIQLFQKHRWQITFASPSNLGEHRLDLTQFEIQEKAIELNNHSFDDFIRQLQPNVVIFDRFMMEEQFGWRVENHCPNAVRILNTEDLHSLREARQQYLKIQSKAYNTNSNNNDQACLDLTPLWNQSAEHLFDLMANTDLAQREIAAILRCDLTLMISKFEVSLLEKAFKVESNLLFNLPFTYPELKTTANNKFENRQHFVFIGNFRHAPNWDSVLWLKESIWPAIRQQLPSAELHVYGAYPAKKVTNLHNPKQGFLVKGWANDALQVIRDARVLLAPLRFGAGIKGKLAEAMLCGTPSVTTPIGSEAMLPENQNHTEWPGFTGETEKELIEHAIELYANENTWQIAQNRGFTLGHQQYQQLQLGDNLMQTVIKLQSQLEAHRKKNFAGSMLRHHHHKSTQYMAQWIEVKNRNKNIK